MHAPPRARTSARGLSGSSEGSSDTQAAALAPATQQLSYGGHCTCCGGHHALRATPAAIAAAAALADALDAAGAIDFDLPPHARDPALSTACCWTTGPGRMLGVLLATPRRGVGSGSTLGSGGGGGGDVLRDSCSVAAAGASAAHDEPAVETAAGGGGVVVLKAFSGQMGPHGACVWHVPGWAGPVGGLLAGGRVYEAYRSLTESYSARLASLEGALAQHPAPLRPALGRQRRQQQRRELKQHQQHQQLQQQDLQEGGPRASEQQQPHDAAAAPPLATACSGEPRSGAAEGEEARRRRAWLEAQRSLLRSRRKALSHELLRAIQLSYRPTNFAGQPLQLLAVYDAAQRRLGRAPPPQPLQRAPRTGASSGGSGNTNGNSSNSTGAPPTLVAAAAAGAGALAFPAGTGDCCAPKLLSEAARRGLVPVGLAEVWYGSPPNTATPQGRRRSEADGLGGDAGTRVHRQLYGPCDKCVAVVGSMLCGADGVAVDAAGGAAAGAAEAARAVAEVAVGAAEAARGAAGALAPSGGKQGADGAAALVVAGTGGGGDVLGVAG